jgi:hypothetical protein
LSLITSRSKVFHFLLIVSVTVVHFGHLIHDITSEEEISSVISFPSTFVTLSQPFKPALYAGDHVIGETILNTQGVSIST